TLQLPGIYRDAEANNKAESRLLRMKNRVRVGWVSTDIGIVYQKGDVVQLRSTYRGADINVLVESVQMISYGRYRVSGLRYDPEHYPSELSLPDGAGVVPVGAILPLSGTVVPSGWAKYTAADGKFIVGAGDTYAVLDTGGSATHAGFSGSVDSDGGHQGSSTYTVINNAFSGSSTLSYYTNKGSDQGAHQHTYSTGTITPDLYRRENILIQKTGGDGSEFPVEAQVFGLPGIAIPDLTRITTAAGRLLQAAAAHANDGLANQFVTMTSGSTSDAHTHHNVLGPFSNREWRVDFSQELHTPTSQGAAHTHDYTLALNRNVKRKTLALYAGTDDYAVAPGMIVLWAGSLGSLPADWSLCLRGDSQVLMADGSEREIKELVERKCTDEVMAFNPETKRLEPRRIVDWFETPVEDQSVWRSVSTRVGSVVRRLWATDNHPVWVEGAGWEPINKQGDIYTSRVATPTLSKIGLDIFKGLLMGDGMISKSGVFGHSQGGVNVDYEHALGDLIGYSVYDHKREEANGWSPAGSVWAKGVISIGQFAPSLSGLFGKRKPGRFSDLGIHGLAFLYMDDGSYTNKNNGESAAFYTYSYDPEKVQGLLKKFGWESYTHKQKLTGKYYVKLTSESSRDFWHKIAPFVPPPMRRKLPERYRDYPYTLTHSDLWDNGGTAVSAAAVRTRASYHESKRCSRRFATKYDIKVEGLSSFVANGTIVHNCDGTGGTEDYTDYFIEIAGTGNEGVAAGDNTVDFSGTGEEVSHTGHNPASPSIEGKKVLSLDHEDTVYHSHNVTDSGSWTPVYFALACIMFNP
ncbi:MAG: hypothetical protein DRH08_14970, partial [Deltaproteobacteria bacterium]